MASKAQVSIALILSLNLVFLTMVSSTCHNGICPPPPSNTNMGHHGHHYPSPDYSRATCSLNPLKFGTCSNIIANNLGNIIFGSPLNSPCCALILGLVDLDAAACLCAALKGNVLGIVNLDVSAALNVILSTCGKSVPSAFQCS
ncbi:14 kDa proline-rich protein DC2.15-like [Humulus lupulus]|uniref:14 kDa proline-rich protein DC2.15-like n=1 Tax=Humulus lupulus TaxID=3486 RepID=UPI002B414577|nr:14 kDa proline-rich protein DC2.15-like [Humulus lupulus]